MSMRSAVGYRTRAEACLPMEALNKGAISFRSEEHTSELQSHSDLVCRLLLEKKKKTTNATIRHASDELAHKQTSTTTSSMTMTAIRTPRICYEPNCANQLYAHTHPRPCRIPQ